MRHFRIQPNPFNPCFLFLAETTNDLRGLAAWQDFVRLALIKLHFLSSCCLRSLCWNNSRPDSICPSFFRYFFLCRSRARSLVSLVLGGDECCLSETLILHGKMSAFGIAAVNPQTHKSQLNELIQSCVFREEYPERILASSSAEPTLVLWVRAEPTHTSHCNITANL